MDTDHFDRATKILFTAGTRRGLVHLMAAVPVLGVLLAADDEEAKAERPVHRLGRRTQQRNRKRRNQRRRNKAQNQNNNDENGGGDGGRRGASSPCLPPTQDLQGAINQLPAGGRLLLCAGTWQDAEPTLIISKDVTITGNSGEPSIITG